MPDPTARAAEHLRVGLRADCERCFGLCCVALAFSASSGFPVDKGVGDPCPNLADDDRCRVHERLAADGLSGCTSYDCFGAGQHVSQVTFRGRSWRDDPSASAGMFAALPVVRQLHELLWYLAEVLDRPAAAPVHAAARERLDEVALARDLPAEGLLALDVAACRRRVNVVLLEASELVRRARRPAPPDHRNADLLGAKLQGADLRAADLRGAYLIAADLRGADLGDADLIGADLRDADVRGTELGTALFLAQAQVNAARGDATTRLPATIVRPSHWR